MEKHDVTYIILTIRQIKCTFVYIQNQLIFVLKMYVTVMWYNDADYMGWECKMGDDSLMWQE